MWDFENNSHELYSNESMHTCYSFGDYHSPRHISILNKGKKKAWKAKYMHTCRASVYSIECGKVAIAKWDMFSNTFLHEVLIQFL